MTTPLTNQCRVATASRTERPWTVTEVVPVQPSPRQRQHCKPPVPFLTSHISASPRLLATYPFIPSRPTVQSNTTSTYGLYAAGRRPLRHFTCVVPQACNVLGVELPFVPDPDTHAHINQSATACPRPPAQGHSRCHHQHGQRVEHDIPPRHLDPSPASPTLPPHVHRPNSRLLEKPSPAEDSHARRDQWLTGLECLVSSESRARRLSPSLPLLYHFRIPG